VAGKQLVRTLNWEPGELHTAALSPDGRRLVVGGGARAGAVSGYELAVWDLDGDQPARTFPAQSGRVDHACFSPDGRHIASCGEDNEKEEVRVWEADTGRLLYTREAGKQGKGGFGDSRGVCFSPDGRRLAGSFYNEVKVWDAATGQEVLSLQGHRHSVAAVCFSPDGQRVASLTGGEIRSGKGPGRGGTISQSCLMAAEVKLWDAHSGVETLSLQGPPVGRGPLRDLAFTPDGKRLLGLAAELRVWDADDGPGAAGPPG
jgi:WD40 repeat protein